MGRQVSAEQRYRAVLEVLWGCSVTEVARRNGVSRQTLNNWRRRYAAEGQSGLTDRSRRPHLSPARLNPAVETLICSLREQHPDWGAKRLRAALCALGITPAPSHTTVHRVLVRNRLLTSEPEEAPQVSASRAESAEENLTALIGAAKDLVDRLDRALGALCARSLREMAECVVCLSGTAPDWALGECVASAGTSALPHCQLSPGIVTWPRPERDSNA